MKYRIKIEKFDFNHNILTQSQVEINEEIFNNIPIGLNKEDIFKLHFEQLLERQIKYENEQNRP